MAMMEEQKFMLEGAENTRDIVSAIKQDNSIVKEATKVISVEELDEMKDEMENLKAGKEELSDFFKEYGEQDQEGVEEELELLKKKWLKKKLVLYQFLIKKIQVLCLLKKLIIRKKKILMLFLLNDIIKLNKIIKIIDFIQTLLKKINYYILN